MGVWRSGGRGLLEAIAGGVAPRRILAELLNIAARHSQGLQWPSSADAVPAFGDALVVFAKEVRQYRFPATGNARYGFEGGRSQDNSYFVKHFTSKGIIVNRKV